MGIQLQFGESVEKTAESITTLRNIREHDDDDGDIEWICILFETSRFHSILVPILQELQELLFGTLHTNNRNCTIKKLTVGNFCNDVETNNRCYDFLFFLSQYLEGSQDTIKEFYYSVGGRIPMTVNDASRFASIISRSNCNLQELYITLRNTDHFLFSVENTFELIFTAVLDKGIRNFYVCVPVTARNSYYKKLIQRACNAGNSKLTTNTTLEALAFLFNETEPSTEPSIHFNDDDINPLVTILKTNTGLKEIGVDGRIILSTTAQNNLMNAARDNTTLTEGFFIGPGSINETLERKLLLSIYNQVAMNKFWKNFTTHYNIVGGKSARNGMNNNTIINNEHHRRKRHKGDNVVPNKTQTLPEKPKPKTIDLSMYPILLEKLTGKPQFLFQFLTSESSLLFQIGDHEQLVATRDDDVTMKTQQNEWQK